ncbi:hypothetical protein DUNSADRAFT_3429 [Dunaliella salina]|uniref:Encoded protein n=1 Tax=Dunaliella salina TaxID=3046 RepID=A0ABQ7GU17_DUNSA|nr:hypothetical protein DUNSADRAFT_3429 [Dunaliella salina]|eukprot:KAF5838059.1 hypothetical protein DUNSADRAFT_3429 [Dunaliella salina]
MGRIGGCQLLFRTCRCCWIGCLVCLCLFQSVFLRGPLLPRKKRSLTRDCNPAYQPGRSREPPDLEWPIKAPLDLLCILFFSFTLPLKAPVRA